nr:hypothetical protein [uncultured Acinetobacter sp.]
MSIGGFYNVLLDGILGASALGLRNVVIMALGYRSTKTSMRTCPMDV